MQWIDYFILIFGIFLIITVALQSSDDNIQDAFSGEKSELYKNRKTMGLEAFLVRASTVLVVLFVASIILALALRGS